MDEIYKKIKELRLLRGYTLKELSERTDLSISFLSQVERGATSLAITSLKKIADALNVKITEFFEEEKQQEHYVVKMDEQKPFQLKGSEFTYVRLNGVFAGRTMEPILVKIPPQQKQSQHFGHSGEEYHYVLKGLLIFYIEGKEYVVREGESIHFPSTCPHSLENPTNSESIILSVLTPVIF
ncbi:helix-turn-helix domain-containing protein [Neobacillus mesonae]|uniref:XRE family transcriptional regulator n=1 Tax=Neobacillus mesonae TaxID=1193713 RepID=A0A3Q9QZD3_9BACI|nr:XRE family transcriptional regulator [Neobacillus mesonae]AZU62360.1 XRE family transcriptional regulator [Neobacillus mesonae]MED4205390.1 XRE family transcriptional regulator [Neobacillus mesonae]